MRFASVRELMRSASLKSTSNEVDTAQECRGHRLSVWAIVVFGLITVVAAFLRLWNLGNWPVFLDEDVYTSTAARLATLPFLEAVSSAHWSKAPGPFYIQGLVGLLTGDVLIAGRLVGALAGVATTMLCFPLARRCFGDGVALLAMALYGLSPLAVMHERMALLDGPLTTLSLLAVLLAWIGIGRLVWIYAVLAAIAGALAVQYKVPGIATALVPLLLLWGHSGRDWRRARLALLAAAGPLLSYVVLSVSPFSSDLAGQNAELQRDPSFGMLLANVATFGDTVNTYMPAGLWLFVLAGAVVLLREQPRLGLLFLALIAAWSVPWLAISRFVPSRYFLPALPFACLFAALALARLPRLAARFRQPGRGGVSLSAAVVSAVYAGSFVAAVQIVFSPTLAPLSKLDDWQYRSGWPSGYGYAEAAAYVARTAQPGSSVAYLVDIRHLVGAGLLGPLPPGVQSFGWQPIDRPLPQGRDGPLYVVVDDADQPPGQRLSAALSLEPRLRLLARFPRPGSETGAHVLVAYEPMAEVKRVMDTAEKAGHYLVLSNGCDRVTIGAALPYEIRGAGRLIDYPPAGLRSPPPDRVLTALEILPTDEMAQLSASLARVAALSTHLWYLRCGETSSADPVVEEWMARSFARVERFGAPYDPFVLLQHATPSLPSQAPEGATRLAVAASWGDEIELVKYTLQVDRSEGGTVLRVTLIWRASRVPEKDYHVFVHLVDRSGKLVAQSDGMPVYDRYPLSKWTAGQYVSDNYDIAVPPGLQVGAGGILVGLYDFETGKRLAVGGSDHLRLPFGGQDQ